MKNKLTLAVLTAMLSASVFAGGMAEDEMDLQRELASTQNELENAKGDLMDQKNRADDLENKVDELSRRIDELSSREPQVIEQKSSSYFGDSNVHGYFASTYMDSNLEDNGDGTFDQQTLNLTFKYELDDNFNFYANIAYAHGAEIYVDNGSVEGTGDLIVEEAWLDWTLVEDKLIAKFGKFNTPVGVWAPKETVHSTLTITDPVMVRWNVAPQFTTGMMLYGTCQLGDMQVEKAFAIGNGKGFRPHSTDSDSNKAISARIGLVIPMDDGNSMTFGLSGFYGEDGYYQDDHDEKVYAVDAGLTLGAFALRAEIIKSRLNMGSENTFDEDGDVWRDAWFAQASYALTEKLSVAYRHDFGDLDLRAFNMGELKVDTIGISYSPIEAVKFKAGYDFYDDDAVSGDQTYEVAGAQVAVLF